VDRILSRIDSWIAKVEKDEPIDWAKERNLMDLELVRGGAQFIKDQQDSEAQHDQKLAEEFS